MCDRVGPALVRWMLDYHALRPDDARFDREFLAAEHWARARWRRAFPPSERAASRASASDAARWARFEAAVDAALDLAVGTRRRTRTTCGARTLRTTSRSPRSKPLGGLAGRRPPCVSSAATVRAAVQRAGMFRSGAARTRALYQDMPRRHLLAGFLVHADATITWAAPFLMFTQLTLTRELEQADARDLRGVLGHHGTALPATEGVAFQLCRLPFGLRLCQLAARFAYKLAQLLLEDARRLAVVADVVADTPAYDRSSCRRPIEVCATHGLPWPDPRAERGEGRRVGEARPGGFEPHVRHLVRLFVPVPATPALVDGRGGVAHAAARAIMVRHPHRQDAHQSNARRDRLGDVLRRDPPPPSGR